MVRKLSFSGRYYRTIPINNPGSEEEVICLDPDRTTLVAIHCWNIGCSGGPSIEPNYAVGMSFPFNLEEAYRICRDIIKPAMDISRRIGVLVSHAEDTSIAMKHPSAMIEADMSEPPLSPLPAEPGVVQGHRNRITDRAYGKNHEKNSPWAKMDRIDFLMPQGNEPFIYQTNQFHRLLSRKGVENIIYTGFATNLCVLDAGGGAIHMAELGYRIFIIREATLGLEFPDTFRQRLNTKYGIRYIETNLGHSIGFADYRRSCEQLIQEV